MITKVDLLGLLGRLPWDDDDPAWGKGPPY
jgi:hypothetical protein